MKKKIIIDTNVWYNISNEEIIKLKEDYELVVPLMILNEIYTSPNLFLSKKTFEGVQKAINIILSNIDNLKFIELNPSILQHQQVVEIIARYKKQKFFK